MKKSKLYAEAMLRRAKKPTQPVGEPTDEEVEGLFAAYERQRAKHPLWQPCPWPPHTPEYAQVVAEREAAGLPPRHPDDLEPDLE